MPPIVGKDFTYIVCYTVFMKNTWIIVLIIVILLAGYFVFFKGNPPKEDKKNIENEENMNTEQTSNLPARAEAGDILSMNYTGRLEDGTVFDSNVDPAFGHAEPFEFTLGAGRVIAGWDEGLVGMKVGEKKTLTIPPEKGYGDRDMGKIPPNSTLIFEVELLEINPTK